MPAASDRSRSVRRVPSASSTSPSRKSMPAGRICRPGRAASVMVMPPPSTTVSSWMMTASAPSGITPPVKIRTASPAPTALSNGRPAATSPITLSRAATCRGVGRAHRIAVHRRHRLRRLGAQRRDVARQHAVMGGIERDHFLGQRLGARENGGKCVGNRHQRQDKTPKAETPKSQARQRLGHVVRRRHVNRGQAPAPARPSMFSARSSKNTMRAAGTPIAFTT